MSRIYISHDNGIPQLGCNDCSSCDSLMGKSLCGNINRGCCHYFPEFSLAEIHRMLHLPDGRDVLDAIICHPGATVNNFNIHVKGIFHKEEYEAYINSGELLETGDIKDHTIFFRTCPFINPGTGCLFPVRFRTTVCNFFICSEMISNHEISQAAEQYIDERSRYSRWMHRESTELQHILTEYGLSLNSDLQGSLRLLAEIPLSEYEFPTLGPLEFTPGP